MDLTSKSITFHQNIVIARSGKVTDKSRSSTLSIAYYRCFLFLCIYIFHDTILEYNNEIVTPLVAQFATIG